MKGRSIIAALATVALAMSPSLAWAKTDKPPTPEQQAKVFERMLTLRDIPRALLVDPGIEYTMKAHGGQHQALCDKNGRDIQGRETNLLYQVEFGETNVLKDPIAFEQKVWPYPTTQAAISEWQYLERQVQMCTGRSEWKSETGGRNIQYLSNGRTQQQVQGRSGIWIWVDARGGGFNPDTEDGGYYVLYLVGNTIQSYEYDYPDAKGLPVNTRNLVQQVGALGANRWLATA